MDVLLFILVMLFGMLVFGIVRYIQYRRQLSRIKSYGIPDKLVIPWSWEDTQKDKPTYAGIQQVMSSVSHRIPTAPHVAELPGRNVPEQPEPAKQRDIKLKHTPERDKVIVKALVHKQLLDRHDLAVLLGVRYQNGLQYIREAEAEYQKQQSA